VLTDLFDPQSEDAVEHVALAERAAAIVVAPATANLIAKAAHGVADDFLTTLLLAARCPVLIAPAMDGGMWGIRRWPRTWPRCAARGVTVMEPDRGALASGLSGRGGCRSRNRSSPPSPPCSRRRRTSRARRRRHRRSTREPIDPVRYISNRSSGKMGYNIAAAALRRGAAVTLVSGPTALTPRRPPPSCPCRRPRRCARRAAPPRGREHRHQGRGRRRLPRAPSVGHSRSRASATSRWS